MPFGIQRWYPLPCIRLRIVGNQKIIAFLTTAGTMHKKGAGVLFYSPAPFLYSLFVFTQINTAPL